jgi:serine/threonine-protein kinase
MAQFDFDSEDDKRNELMGLAWVQRLAGDTAGAKATAEQARNTFEQAYKEQLDNAQSSPRTLGDLARDLSGAYALIGEKDLAIKTAKRAIMHLPRATHAAIGPDCEENLALIQTMFGENNRAISTLAQLLHTPYYSSWYGATPITPALLRLDPLWDPLRGDPAFQKLCEEKQDLTTNGH